jgi:hypothetical protein
MKRKNDRKIPKEMLAKNFLSLANAIQIDIN